MKRMLTWTSALAAAMLLLALAFSGVPSDAAPLPGDGSGGELDGKAIFLAQKCNLCHGVESAGIEATTKSEKMKGPDLTGAAAKVEPGWLGKYLRKQEQHEGKDHKKEFKGSDEELQALIDWLLEQKAEG